MKSLQPDDYTVDPESQAVALTESGVEKAQKLTIKLTTITTLKILI